MPSTRPTPSLIPKSEPEPNTVGQLSRREGPSSMPIRRAAPLSLLHLAAGSSALAPVEAEFQRQLAAAMDQVSSGMRGLLVSCVPNPPRVWH